MSEAVPQDFRFRQALADLKFHSSCVPAATVWRIAAMTAHPSPSLLRSLEWLFRGKAPYTAITRQPTAEAALLLASALSDEDEESFRYATCLLLIGRLESTSRADNLFWRWPAVQAASAGAHAPLRAAIMCGFREAQRLGRVDFGRAPAPEDCMTRSPGQVAALLEAQAGVPEVDRLQAALAGDRSASDAGALWSDENGRLWRLPDPASQAVLAGYRHLYERPQSMDLAPDRVAPVIPPVADLPDA